LNLIARLISTLPEGYQVTGLNEFEFSCAVVAHGQRIIEQSATNMNPAANRILFLGMKAVFCGVNRDDLSMVFHPSLQAICGNHKRAKLE
jgi:hypothetical protein